MFPDVFSLGSASECASNLQPSHNLCSSVLYRFTTNYTEYCHVLGDYKRGLDW
jgi:hypothetical protein